MCHTTPKWVFMLLLESVNRIRKCVQLNGLDFRFLPKIIHQYNNPLVLTDRVISGTGMVQAVKIELG